MSFFYEGDLAMFRGFYTVASGMLAQQRRTELLTNNMSNANTPGYKADQSSLRAFPEMLLQSFGQQKLPIKGGTNVPFNTLVGPVNTGVYMQETLPNFVQGDVRETGLGTDLALVDVNMPVNENGLMGSIFFTVEHPEGGVRYTRNGNFTVDAAGFLTTASGQYILDENGNRILLQSDQFTVTEEGFIMENNQVTARIGVAFAENPATLIKEGNGLFRTENDDLLPSAYTNENVFFRTQQGFLERSNVDATKTMTELLSAYRAFEANQKVLQAYDRSMEKAANEIGRL